MIFKHIGCILEATFTVIYIMQQKLNTVTCKAMLKRGSWTKSIYVSESKLNRRRWWQLYGTDMLTNPTFNQQSATQFFSLAFRYNAQRVKVIWICIDYKAVGPLYDREEKGRHGCGSDCGHNRFSFMRVNPASVCEHS